MAGRPHLTIILRALPKLTMLVFMMLVLYQPTSVASSPQVINGIIDLSEWDFIRQGPVDLHGDYEFYWQAHLTTRDLIAIDRDDVVTVPVPGEWNGQIINGEPIDGHGFATYRVNILNTYQGQLALKVPDFGTAFRLIVDGKLLLESGRAGTDAASTTPRYRPAIVTFSPTGNRVEVIVQVSNFDHRLGGLWLPMYLGTANQLMNLRESQLARDLILFGSILILGLYNLALYGFRREARSSLFLGLFCILLAVRQLTVGDRYLTRVFETLPYEWYLRVEYLGWFLAATAFVAFLQNIFPREVNRIAAYLIHGIFGLGALIVLFTSPALFTHLVPPYQLLTLAAMAYGTFVLFLALARKREGSLILLFAYAVFYLTTVSDMLVNEGISNNILLLDLGLFVFVLCQSVLISYRFTRSYKTIEQQRSQLEAANLKLRTQEKLRRDAETESVALHKRIVQSEKMEAIGLLAGGVAHDLNNILSNTVTYPELALLDLPKNSPLARPLELTRQAGLRAAAVIQDMLTLARRGVVTREVMNVNDAIESYLESIEHTMMTSNHPDVRITTDLAEDLDNIEGSPVAINKLIMNLIANAMEAQPDGGTISVITYNHHSSGEQLRYMTIKQGDYIVISIEDQGTGIAEEDLERLFEPFFTTKVMGQSGSGLGMSVVWGVVYDLGGAIDVTSVMGKRTRFDIYMPTTAKPLPEKIEKQPLEQLMGRGKQILVVDDMADQRELTQQVLEKLNYRVTVCANGQEAVNLVKKQHFDLIILDMITEDDWDGLRTYQELAKVQSDIKTLLVSGFTETDQVEEAQTLGAGPFLRKPFTLEAMGTLLKSVLS